MKIVAPMLGVILAVLLVFGCASGGKTKQSNEETIARSFLQALSDDDVSSALSLVSDDILFREEPPGARAQGKAQIEELLRYSATWHQRNSVTSPIKVDNGKVTFSAKIAGDDLMIMGIASVAANVEFQMHGGKISSWLINPAAADWKKVSDYYAGGIGVEWAAAGQQVIVRQVAPDSPAAKAGLMPGDVVVAVNKISASLMRDGEFQLRTRGPVGSDVLVTVIHEGTNAPVDIQITRVDLSQLHF